MSKRLGIQIGFAGSPSERADIIKRVQIAEDLGVESAWVAEAWGRDAFSMLTHLAVTTKKIQLGTAIVNVFSRTPAVLAMTFGTLDELSGGRAIIGLGSSGANVVEHWHGVPFEKPATRLREYIEIIDMIMRQEKLNYGGKVFKLERGFTMQFPTVREHIPTYIASITPKSMEQTGEIADGWIPIYWPKDKIASGIDTLLVGAKKSGKTRADHGCGKRGEDPGSGAGTDRVLRRTDGIVLLRDARAARVRGRGREDQGRLGGARPEGGRCRRLRPHARPDRRRRATRALQGRAR